MEKLSVSECETEAETVMVDDALCDALALNETLVDCDPLFDKLELTLREIVCASLSLGDIVVDREDEVVGL